VKWQWISSNIGSQGTSWEYFRQFKQLYSSVTGRYMNTNGSKEIQKVRPNLQGSVVLTNVGGKPVIGFDGLLALLTFNIAYDTGIFRSERQRVELLGIYLFLGYTGGRSGEFVDNEKQPPKGGSLEEIFEQEDDEAPDGS
jgi:hypothetical protein